MKPPKGLKLHQLLRDMSSDEYHGTPGTFSSSQFKDMLKGERLFIEKHIKKSRPRDESEAFDVGTYFHTMVLEPHKIKTECVVFTGKVRRGDKWEAFKKKHKGKAIVTQFQKDQALGLVKAVKNSVIAQDLLDGDPEVSLFVEINVHDGQIYAPYFGKMLTLNGWVDGPKKRIPGAFVIFVKVRADIKGKIRIGDLKSTSGDAECDDTIHLRTKKYGYQLSAALYLDMFSLLEPTLEEFWLIYASKEFYNCRSWRLSDDKLRVGRAQYMWAMRRMADLAANNWESIESPGVIRVLPEERHWLEERDADLL